MKKNLYAIAVLVFSIFLFGTAGAMELNVITFEEGCWQIAVSMVSALWFWNLLRIEETRQARRRF